MALIHADFPSGQQGLYGINSALMLNGVWAELLGTVPSEVSLVSDPDPSIGSAGVVFLTGGGGGVPRVNGARFAVPSPQKTQGGSVMLWMSNLPSSPNNTPLIQFRNSSNAALFSIRVNTNGSILAQAGTINAFGNWPGAIYGESTPAVVANAYNLIEWKVFSDAAAGTIEVRVNGLPVLELDTLNTGGADIAQFVVGGASGLSTDVSTSPYWKNLILWDDTGSYVNDFLGNVFPHDLYVNEDDDFNWDTSRTGGGGEGFDLIADHKPHNLLSKSGTPDPRIADNDTISIAGTYYRWTSGTVDPGGEAGTSANPWRVALGADDSEAFENMAAAINLTGTPGTTYSTGLVAANSACIAVNWTGSVLQIEPIDGVTRAIAVTETGANLAWSNASTFPIGPTDTSFIEAGFTTGPVFPDPSKFRLTKLPPDITTVRAVMDINRMMKTDGGDCNLTSSLSPDDTNWFDGADRPATVAFTFWKDISYVSPATSAPWTPAEIDNLYKKVDRTL